MPLARSLAADGRLNPDPSAPVVVYCEGENYDIYQLVGERGVLAIRELHAELDDMENPAENTLLASSEDGNVRLYLLNTGGIPAERAFEGQSQRLCLHFPQL